MHLLSLFIGNWMQSTGSQASADLGTTYTGTLSSGIVYANNGQATGDSGCSPGARVARKKGSEEVKQEILSNEIIIYPNPIGQGNILKVNFTTKLTHDKVNVVLTNLSGQSVFNHVVNVKNGVNKLEFNTGALGQGIYILRLNSSEGQVVRKIKIEN